MTREYIQNRIIQSHQLARDPSLVLCVERFDNAAGAHSEKVLSLLRRAMAQPDRSLVVMADGAIVFGFSRPSA